jgi:ABC-type glutathione transport system ATPase component
VQVRQPSRHRHSGTTANPLGSRASVPSEEQPTTVTDSILEVRDLVKQYPTITAVAGVSFAVPEGICFGLLGPLPG